MSVFEGRVIKKMPNSFIATIREKDSRDGYEEDIEILMLSVKVRDRGNVCPGAKFVLSMAPKGKSSLGFCGDIFCTGEIHFG